VPVACQELKELPARIGLCLHEVTYVRPVEAAHEKLWILQCQPFDNLLPGRRGRSCRQCHARNTGEQAREFIQRKVIGTEIVTPLRNTMSFVDRDERYRQRREQ